MSTNGVRTMDGNEAVASVAYRLNDVIAIYPITPASVMGELCDEWSAKLQHNIWNDVPTVVEMQSEGGAAGAVHGALMAGSQATTFTASQGLLLMLPNMYKLAGELTPVVIHVAARTVASHALSIFCDHSDVMACRQTGFALLASATVQQAHDFACIAQAATLRSRVPFLHFFDGFRTSHELVKVQQLSDEDLGVLIDETWRDGRQQAALSPDHPTLRGTAQNPDAFFQAREAANRFYRDCPTVVEDEMARFAARTGRRYELFEYHGHPEPRTVLIAMGSATSTIEETVGELVAQGQRVGVVRVALYRPFAVQRFLTALPASTTRVAVLDRTKEAGAVGEPLYLDVVAALAEGARLHDCEVFGGRYGLSSKELSPAMVAAVFKALEEPSPRRHFSLGITDDVTHESLPVDADFELPEHDLYEAVFFGLGSDGTVGASKNTIKIVGDNSDFTVQGYFVYDSKKSGAVTVSHLRFGRRPFERPYLVQQAHFVGCHQLDLLEQLPVLERARAGATLLINSPHGQGTWSPLAREVQQEILSKQLRVYVIDAYSIALENGLGRHINTVMQTCFFALSGIVPLDEALANLKQAIAKTYGKKGPEVVQHNLDAVDATLRCLSELTLAGVTAGSRPRRRPVADNAPDFVKRVTATLLAGHGDWLPVSAFPVDGTWPTGTSRWEKRALASEVPKWDAELCIQCNKCVLVCPHAAIRAKVYEHLPASAPAGFQSVVWKDGELKGQHYTLQVAPDDCTGCRACVEVCPAKDKHNPRHRALEMSPLAALHDAERARFDFFLSLPEVDRRHVHLDVKGSQLYLPLFEYSGACAGCGETPYLKLLTQLFGDRALIANATGCSSIYGANLPTTPYAADADGRGPAWANSLFEDNAEFGYGMRLSVDAHTAEAKRLLRGLASRLPESLVSALLDTDQATEAGVFQERELIAALRQRLASVDSRDARRLELLADYVLKKSVWLVGGDGWAYDIGFGGLDHVLASDRDVNVLVLDTEVYSNTGGQKSKATPLGASAKFASSGKDTPKKDLALHAMSYGHVYVASVAYGAKDAQTVRAFVEAESFPGPSLIIAYSHCIAHGYDLAQGPHQQKLAVDSGVWPLFRFDPRRIEQGEPPLVLDATPGKAKVSEYLAGEGRFRAVERLDAHHYHELCARAEREVLHRIELYAQLSHLKLSASHPVVAHGATTTGKTENLAATRP
ncbi:MAG TPA: pyruvate:ferredoxin (flavodoxin) oxidoreductase [Polyangiaceae bacterium]|nr:pyruvate:ferredoxin (flavodoxin) oxidoreductase [Polyangiaceae bacterium]